MGGSKIVVSSSVARESEFAGASRFAARAAKDEKQKRSKTSEFGTNQIPSFPTKLSFLGRERYPIHVYRFLGRLRETRIGAQTICKPS